MSSNTAGAEAFFYTVEERVPDNVVRILVDPSVTSIPANAFEGRKTLARWSSAKASLKLGNVHSCIATTQ